MPVQLFRANFNLAIHLTLEFHFDRVSLLRNHFEAMRPYHIFRTWAQETIAIVLAIGLIAAIASVLAVHNGKPVPDWGANLNLNALLALLSTFLRALLVIIVAQVISQRKWDWYGVDRTRSLADLQKFDAGSRGAFGALLLLPTVLFKDFVTFAAATVLLVSFLVGPFVQQASRTTVCSFPSLDGNASVPFAHWVPGNGGFHLPAGNPYGAAAPDISVAILSSVISPDGVENKIGTSCATGNCTFSDLAGTRSLSKASDEGNLTGYTTVGVCNVCTDVTSLVTIQKNKTTTYIVNRLPNGFNTTSGTWNAATLKPSPNLNWMGNLLTDDGRAKSRWAYVNATFLSYWNNKTVASVCSLYPCVRTYNTMIRDSQLYEKETKSDVMKIDFDERRSSSLDNVGDHDTRTNIYFNYTAIETPCRVDGHIIEKGGNIPNGVAATKLQLYDFGSQPPISQNITWPEQCIYRHDPRFVGVISRIMVDEIFDGYCSTYKGVACTKSGQPTSGEMPSLGAAAVAQTLYNNGNLSYANITRYFDSVATAMTNRFRFQYGSALKRKGDLPDQAEPLDMLHGTAWETKICVQMLAQWLILPICLTSITIALSVWTIITNWRRRHIIPVWKDSVLPLLFYGQNFKSQDPNSASVRSFGAEPNMAKTDELMETSAMEKASKDIMVTFRWPDGTAAHGREEQEHQSSTALLQQDSFPMRRRDRRGSFGGHGDLNGS
jgi:hypothetical protein